MHTLTNLVQRLADSGVDFIIIGGFAGVLHGSSLVTRDLDICAVLTSENVEKLREALKDLHPCHRMTPKRLSFLQAPPAGETVNNLYLNTDWGIVDILSSVEGVGDFAKLSTNAESITLAGKTCHLIGLEDLIRAKQAIGREKDLLAVKELRAIAQKRSRKQN